MLALVGSHWGFLAECEGSYKQQQLGTRSPKLWLYCYLRRYDDSPVAITRLDAIVSVKWRLICASTNILAWRFSKSIGYTSENCFAREAMMLWRRECLLPGDLLWWKHWDLRDILNAVSATMICARLILLMVNLGRSSWRKISLRSFDLSKSESQPTTLLRFVDLNENLDFFFFKIAGLDLIYQLQNNLLYYVEDHFRTFELYKILILQDATPWSCWYPHKYRYQQLVVFMQLLFQDTDHKCNLVCGRRLTCGLHRCEEPCHRGNCPTCWQVSKWMTS